MATAKSQRERIDLILTQQEVFGELLLAEEREYLMDHSRVLNITSGEVLCQQQEQDSRVFVLLMGEVEVTETKAGQPVVLARLRRGEIFGEIAALFHLPRMSMVTAIRSSVVLAVPGSVFEYVVSQRAVLRDAVWQRYHQRLCITVLRMVRQFRQLPEESLMPLLANLSLSSYKPDTPIVYAGSPGDNLSIIISGEVIVSQYHESGVERRIASLRAGDYFGEWSILTGAPCSASITAATQVSLLSVGRSEFLRFIQDNPSVREGIDMVAHNRQAQANRPTSNCFL